MRIEEEFGGTEILSMFSKRISSQLSQLTVNINIEYRTLFVSFFLEFLFTIIRFYSQSKWKS